MGILEFFLGKKRLVGDMNITFFNQNEASVEMDIQDTPNREECMIQLFAFYYAKMLYNLGEGEDSKSLMFIINSSLDLIIEEEKIAEEKMQKISVLPDGLSIKRRNSVPQAIYAADLYENSSGDRFVITKMDAGEEEYFSIISTMMALQWLLDNLSENGITYLVGVITGMHKFYETTSPYSLSSMNACPKSAFQFADDLIMKIKPR